MHHWFRPFWLYLLVFTGLLVSTATAESYYASVEKLSVSDGLPDTTVYSLAKDNQGFLWLGTPTALSRFDGYQFRSYTRTGVPGSKLLVTSAGNIFIDSKQRIWIGTWGEGLVVYDEKMQLLHHFVEQQGVEGAILSNMVQVIFEDSDGDIWVGTNGGGLARFNETGATFTNFVNQKDDPASLSQNRVWSIAQTTDGSLWAATSNGLNRMNKNQMGKFTRYRHDPLDKTSLDHVLVRSLLAEGDNLWVGTERGFGLFDSRQGTFKRFELFRGAGRAAITKLTRDSIGGIWIGTQKGMFRFEPDNNRLTPLASESSYQLFPHNDIRDMVLDDAGILWVATRYAGLIKINLTSNNFSFYQRYQSKGRLDNTINKVTAMHVDKDNILWLGIGDGLLYQNLNTNVLNRFDTGDMPEQLTIVAIAETADGELWLGGPFGLISVDKARKKVTDRSLVLASIDIKHVVSLLADRQGNLWIGTTHEGLLRYDSRKAITRFSHEPGSLDAISSSNITALFEDQLGRIWIGTNGGGLNRYDEPHNRFVKYVTDMTEPDSLANNIVNIIYQTEDSVMWVGTPKSLDRLDDSTGRFSHFGIPEGMVNSHIKAVVEDSFGDLWLSTGKGLSQFKRSQSYFYNFSDKDSLQSNEFLARSVVKAPGNRLFFGNNTGFHEVNPTQVKINTHIPNVVITDVWVDNKRILRHRFDDGKPLVLGYEVKSVRLQFAALDFQAPNKNLYSYTLGGFDELWSEPGNNRFAIYTSLNPGEYEFKVKGSNNSNQWNNTGARLKIIIEPPWWTLWYVQLLLLVSLAALVYGYSRYRLRQMAIAQHHLEREVAMRTKEIVEQKEELETAHRQLNDRSKDLKDSNEELSLALKRSEQYRDQLVEKEKMAALGQMVAGISHEINTPIGLGVTATTLMQDRLAAIKQLYDDKKLSPAKLEKYFCEADESLDIIFRNLDRAAELIRSFKQVSVDQSSDERRTFVASQLIDEVLLSLRPDLKKVSHQVVVDCDKSIAIKSKPGAISQILINLIHNSLLHAFDGIDNGRMKITVALKGNDCELTYSDNGHGVSKEIENRIFEPFATTKRGEGGSGLGMHLVYNLATQALAGSITLNSESEQGIEVKLVFPVASRKKERRTVQELIDS